MSHAKLESLLRELGTLSAECGSASLAALVEREADAWFRDGADKPGAPEQGAAVALMVAAALQSGLRARRAAVDVDPGRVEQRIQRLAEPPTDTAHAAEHIEREIGRLREKLKADIAQLNEDLARELPLSVRHASVDDLRRHFPAFVEHTFQRWLEEELRELERELTELADHTDALVRQTDSALSRASVVPELGTRALEVDSFPRDFGVFALSTVGIAVLFTNALFGGALLLLAPVVARYGRERNEAELRSRAGIEAARAVREATERLEVELLRRVEAFADRLEAFTVSASAPARQGIVEMLEHGIQQRAEAGSEAERCDGWQQRLSGLVARLEALELGPRAERTAS